MTPCCRVCGTELIGELVSCERCQTPHHRDCWEYWGRCATYGCTGLERPVERKPQLPDQPAGLEVQSVAGRARYLPRRPLVRANRALLYSREGAHVRLADDEVALQMPPEMVHEIPVPRYQAVFRHALVLGGTVATFAALTVMALTGGDAPYLGAAVTTALALVAAHRIERKRGFQQADRMWLVSGERSELTLEAHRPGHFGRLDTVRVRRKLVIPATGGERLRARGVALKPAFGGGDERGVVKAYRLQLACELPGGGIELIAPVPVPGKGEPRGDFLKELTRVRALGQQIALLFRVPYAEA